MFTWQQKRCVHYAERARDRFLQEQTGWVWGAVFDTLKNGAGDNGFTVEYSGWAVGFLYSSLGGDGWRAVSVSGRAMVFSDKKLEINSSIKWFEFPIREFFL